MLLLEFSAVLMHFDHLPQQWVAFEEEKTGFLVFRSSIEPWIDAISNLFRPDLFVLISSRLQIFEPRSVT
ncbi:hypothetical protein BGP75_09250 [Motiliproteus sp. MSK22-1]|nr:hypothetical protein BGP75_09250 [Motiliproteus sp. MSK22-1]